MLVLWDVDGNKIIEHDEHNEGANILSADPPYTSASADRMVDVAEITNSLERVAGSKPEALYPLSADPDCNDLDALHLGGKRYRVKVFRDVSLVGNARKRREIKMLSRECAMMEWMSAFPGVPVPKVLAREVNTEGSPYIVTEYPKGHGLYGRFTELSHEQKQTNLQSYADVVLSMFRIPCPSFIGTIVFFSADDDTAQLGPCVHPFDGTRAPSLYERIEDYFGWLLNKKRTLLTDTAKRAKEEKDAALKPAARMTPRQMIPKPDPELARIRRGFARLEVHLADAIRNLDAPLLRSVPAHEDLSPRNVWIDAEGRVTGIVDWGAHIVKPAVLAAEYPTWLSYPDHEHPELDAKGERYMDSPEEAERLCVKFDNILLERDAEYYNALKEGIFLRMAEAWLKDASSDLKQLQAVMSHAVVNMV